MQKVEISLSYLPGRGSILLGIIGPEPLPGGYKKQIKIL